MCVFFPTKADGILFQNSRIFISLLNSLLWYKLTKIVIIYHTFYLFIDLRFMPHLSSKRHEKSVNESIGKMRHKPVVS